MRFMMLAISVGDESAAAEAAPGAKAAPGAEAAGKMMAYNTSLQKAGILLALDELYPPRAGALISYTGGKAMVTEEPGAEPKEVIGRCWILQVRSREEAIEWAKRAPMSNNERMEVRRCHEMSDFPEEIRKAAEGLERVIR